ncbi:MAG: TetR/AcrR family transcriptional regulator [Firmicutes bacterium]|nr:TetR/AcrR family transcriptional regulator [Bacillota bacterium]
MIDKKADIFNCGRELFYSKGFKDTGISDITKMAGIGVGTFYNYYSSKEKLFFEIYMQENEKTKKLIVESLDLNDDPITLVQKFVTQMISAMNSNQILKEWYNRDVFNKLEQYYREEDRNNCGFLHDFFTELFKKWKTEGKIRDDIDDQMILAFFDSLTYIDTHKEEIGIHHFPQILLFLVEFIIKGLTDCRK